MKFHSLIILVILGACNQNPKTEGKPGSRSPVYSDHSDFFRKQETNLRKEYNKLFSSIADQLGPIEIEINETQSFDSLDDITGILISAKGVPDWSYSEKLILYSRYGQILFESPFHQIHPEMKIPECGVPQHKFGNIYTRYVAGSKYIFSEIDTYYYPCGGQPETKIMTTYIYTANDYSKLDSLEGFYQRREESAKGTTRETTISFHKDFIQATTTEGVTTTSRKYKLSSSGLEELK